MRAFESSPVHCLNCRPSGNRRRPENGGTIAILFHKQLRQETTSNRDNTPVINVIQNAFGCGFTVSKVKIFPYPGDEMIFECTFNDLMEKIWRNQLAYVGTWKFISKGLDGKTSQSYIESSSPSYHHIGNNTMLLPQRSNILCHYQSLSDLFCTRLL
jgi:hypothetical protein